MRLGLQIFGVYFFAASGQADTGHDPLAGNFGLRITDSKAEKPNFSEDAFHVKGRSSLGFVYDEDTFGRTEYNRAPHTATVDHSDVFDHGRVITVGSVGVPLVTADYSNGALSLRHNNIYSAARGSSLENAQGGSPHSLRASYANTHNSYDNGQAISSNLGPHDNFPDDSGYKHGHEISGESKYESSSDISYGNFGDLGNDSADDSSISGSFSDGDNNGGNDETDDDSLHIPVYNRHSKFEPHYLEESDERSREVESSEYESPDGPDHESSDSAHDSSSSHSFSETENKGSVGLEYSDIFDDSSHTLQDSKEYQSSRDERHEFGISNFKNNVAAHGNETPISKEHKGLISTDYGKHINAAPTKHIESDGRMNIKEFSSKYRDASGREFEGSNNPHSQTVTIDDNTKHLLSNGNGYGRHDGSGQNSLISINEGSSGSGHESISTNKNDELMVSNHDGASDLRLGGFPLLRHRFSPSIRPHGQSSNDQEKFGDDGNEESLESIYNEGDAANHGSITGLENLSGGTADGRGDIARQHGDGILSNHGRSPYLGNNNIAYTRRGEILNFSPFVPSSAVPIRSSVRHLSTASAHYGVPLDTERSLLHDVGQRPSVVFGPTTTSGIGHGVPDEQSHGSAVPSIQRAPEEISHSNIVTGSHDRSIGTLHGTSLTLGQGVDIGLFKGHDHSKELNRGATSSFGQSRSTVDTISNANGGYTHENFAGLVHRSFSDKTHAPSNPKIVARATVNFNMGAPQRRQSHDLRSDTLSKGTETKAFGLFGKEFLGGFPGGPGEIHTGNANGRNRGLRRKRNSVLPREEFRYSGNQILDGLISL